MFARRLGLVTVPTTIILPMSMVASTTPVPAAMATLAIPRAMPNRLTHTQPLNLVAARRP
ncbi:hypothetical protein K474DRAFT_1665161 [Panus rudis PR-1116 ss-1]|nr:hypothetical protein K474DRAFT_1670739 [Panus rudis PR-1116 ss-1]KAI0070059.1 hypothetical protein K474DRAFT_1670454 [Panus rudis PR-1116 ss-1]KAI0074625.1 hypothetical protein K474DRAFT_1665161 [Panus rudis PR-1116 ss-1]